MQSGTITEEGRRLAAALRRNPVRIIPDKRKILELVVLF